MKKFHPKIKKEYEEGFCLKKKSLKTTSNTKLEEKLK